MQRAVAIRGLGALVASVYSWEGVVGVREMVKPLLQGLGKEEGGICNAMGWIQTAFWIGQIYAVYNKDPIH